MPVLDTNKNLIRSVDAIYFSYEDAIKTLTLGLLKLKYTRRQWIVPNLISLYLSSYTQDEGN
jgi:23S rRNA A1618 N6-methylase RlmF